MATSAIKGCSGETCTSDSEFRSLAWPIRTARFALGTIRRTSALDVNCKAHDVDNLYVVDGSFFPSSAAVNPALTIMANALRVGDHLMKRLGVTRQTTNSSADRYRSATDGKQVDRDMTGSSVRLSPVAARSVCAAVCPCCSFSLSSGARQTALVEGVDAIGITVSDMDRAVDFYSKVLTFEKVSDTEVAGERLRTSRRCVRIAHARGANEAGRRVHRTHRVSRAERPPDPR